MAVRNETAAEKVTTKTETVIGKAMPNYFRVKAHFC